MEISLEKIELVKDRTGVSYKEAKDALIKADGSVVDAIIMIEDEIDIAPKTKAGDQASQIVEKIKVLVNKGNISRIVVKRNDVTILNIPVTLGLIGVVCVPWFSVFTTIMALGVKCNIELIKDNGEVVSISDKASETFEDVKENCSVIADDLKEKGGDAFSQAKGKASSVMNKVKSEADDYFDDDDDYFNFDDFDDSVLDDDSVDEKESSGKDFVREFADEFTDKKEEIDESEESEAEDLEEKIEETAEEIEDKVEDIADEVSDNLEKAGEKFEETIEGYKSKKSRFKFFE